MGDLNSKRPFVNAIGIQSGLHHINGQVIQFGNSGPYNSFHNFKFHFRTTDFQPADLIGKRGNTGNDLPATSAKFWFTTELC